MTARKMFSRSIDGFGFPLCSRVYLKTSWETLMPILRNKLSESFLHSHSWSQLWRQFMFFVNRKKSRQKPLTDAATWSKPQIPSSHIFDLFWAFSESIKARRRRWKQQPAQTKFYFRSIFRSTWKTFQSRWRTFAKRAAENWVFFCASKQAYKAEW